MIDRKEDPGLLEREMFEFWPNAKRHFPKEKPDSSAEVLMAFFLNGP